MKLIILFLFHVAWAFKMPVLNHEISQPFSMKVMTQPNMFKDLLNLQCVVLIRLIEK